jgi:AhpC/TSA antioxidant enzyme
VQLHRDREEFEAAGVELAVIGQGSPKHARHFKEQHDLEVTLLVDPDRRTYDAAGAKMAGVTDLFGPRVALRGLKAVAGERVVQGRTIGHPAQLGGVLVIAPGGAVTWSHLARDAGDNPPNEAVLDAAREAAGDA